MDYTEIDRLDTQIDALWRYGKNLEAIARRGVTVPRDELWVMLGEAELHRVDVLALAPGIDRSALRSRLERVTAWLWFLYTYGSALTSLSAATVERLLTAEVPLVGRAEHFTEALIVVTRAPRSARLWEMARKVGFALRADAQAAHDDATLRGLWDAYRFLVPTRLLEDYQDPEPATGPNVVRSVFPGGLPGLGRRR